MLEIEMVEFDDETLAYALFSNQTKSLEDGIYTIYNFGNEIYRQYNLYEIKDRFSGKPLFEVREQKFTIDPTKDFDDIKMTFNNLKGETFSLNKLNTILKEEEPNPNLFAYIETTLLWFDTVEKSSMFHYKFLMGLTKYIGFSPEVTDTNMPYFNLEEGKYQNKATGKHCIFGEQLILFNSILGTKFDIDNEKLISSTEKQELLNMILLYFKLHLQSFKSPKSLAVLNQVFN